MYLSVSPSKMILKNVNLTPKRGVGRSNRLGDAVKNTGKTGMPGFSAFFIFLTETEIKMMNEYSKLIGKKDLFAIQFKIEEVRNP